MEQPGRPAPKRSDYDTVVLQMVNEMAQVAGTYVENESIGAVSVIAVSPEGRYVGAHIIEKMTSGSQKPEVDRLKRTKASSRLQLLLELQKQVEVLKRQLEAQIQNEQIEN